MDNGRIPRSEPRVVIAHPSRAVADALVHVFTKHAFAVVAAVRTCAEAKEACIKYSPSAVIAAASLPYGELTELSREMRQMNTRTSLVLLGDGTADEFGVLVGTSASGFVGPTAGEKELAQAVDEVLSGALVLVGVEGEGMGADFFSSLNGANRTSKMWDVTPREREIIALLCKGYSNREIAARLVISEHTVRTHVQNIRSKLNVRSKLEAALLALKVGLTTPDELVGAGMVRGAVGHGTNGHATNGHGTNGHATNGHRTNGVNGHGTNGHGVNGQAG